MLSEKLWNLRNIYLLTQEDIAKAMGIDRSTYAYYKLGRTEPSLDKLMLFATFYQVSADFLLDLPPVKNKKNQKKQRPFWHIHLMRTILLNLPIIRIFDD